MQALFPNPDALLRPGLYAKVRAATETARGAVLVPQRAVQEIQGVYQVAVVGSDDKVTLRTVKMGAAGGRLCGSSTTASSPASASSPQGLQNVKDGIVVNADAGRVAATTTRRRRQG